MPTAADFQVAADSLRSAIDAAGLAVGHLDRVGDHGIHGGTLESLVDRAFDEQRSLFDALGRSLANALEVAEYRRVVCEGYARRYAQWVNEAHDWDRRMQTVGPNMTHSRPRMPSPPAPWAEL